MRERSWTEYCRNDMVFGRDGVLCGFGKPQFAVLLAITRYVRTIRQRSGIVLGLRHIAVYRAAGGTDERPAHSSHLARAHVPACSRFSLIALSLAFPAAAFAQSSSPFDQWADLDPEPVYRHHRQGGEPDRHRDRRLSAFSQKVDVFIVC